MIVLFATTEANPFISDGGLANVSTSLPIALKNEGVDCRVVMPFYSAINEKYRRRMKYIASFTVDVPFQKQTCRVYGTMENGVIYYLLDNERYFNRRGIYGFYDDAERFSFFSRAVISMIENLELDVDIIHANNWQTAIIPVFLKLYPALYGTVSRVKTVFTIHNIMFQGKFSTEILSSVLGLDEKAHDVLLYDNCLNLMKGGILTADGVSTVSPTYAKEIYDPWFANGLDKFLSQSDRNIRGILNGIDTNFYNPETDRVIYKRYSAKNYSDKVKNKEELLRNLGLDDGENSFTVGVVTSFLETRGLELIRYGIKELLALGIKLIFLGQGDYAFEKFLRKLKEEYPNQVSVNIKTAPDFARKIYAGADAMLMPSKIEPCGLQQMVALRYGTIPIVRATGGFLDTITDFSEGENGNGYLFKTYNAGDMVSAVARAAKDYQDEDGWQEKIGRCMQCDFSWKKSAKLYHEMYKEILTENR
ncbi:MAG: glycogen synthase [Oscillospiraceae bacterium]|nr:glycogen synthase [Oscillospiraceae bacterium]